MTQLLPSLQLEPTETLSCNLQSLPMTQFSPTMTKLPISQFLPIFALGDMIALGEITGLLQSSCGFVLFCNSLTTFTKVRRGLSTNTCCVPCLGCSCPFICLLHNITPPPDRTMSIVAFSGSLEQKVRSSLLASPSAAKWWKDFIGSPSISNSIPKMPNTSVIFQLGSTVAAFSTIMPKVYFSIVERRFPSCCSTAFESCRLSTPDAEIITFSPFDCDKTIPEDSTSIGAGDIESGSAARDLVGFGG